MQSVIMTNGKHVPNIGLGTYKGVEHAIKVGYRHIDCATLYNNEAGVGQAMKKLFDNNVISRDELFVTSKPGPDYFPLDSQGNARFDLVSIEDTWKAMENLVDDGLVKSIGLSNFNKRQIDQILAVCRIKPVMLQIESHLDFLNQKLIDYAQSLGLKVTAYSPLGSPGFAKNYENLVSRPIVCKIAAKYSKTPGQILLRHCFQRNLIVIPKSSNFDRIKDNISIFDFNLSEEDMNTLSASTANERRVNPIR